MTRVSLPLPVLILQTSVIGPSLSLAASFAPIRDQRAPVSSFALKRFHVLPFSRRIRTYSHRPSIFISLPRQHSSGAVAYSDRGNAHVAVERKRRVRMAAPHRADKRAAVRSSDFGRCRNLHSHGDLFIFNWEREPLVEATQVLLANLVDRALTDHD